MMHKNSHCKPLVCGSEEEVVGIGKVRIEVGFASVDSDEDQAQVYPAQTLMGS